MKTVEQIIAKRQVLTLAVAKTLVGKTISVTNAEYEANRPSVRTGKVLDIKSKWDIAGEEDYTSIDAKFETRQDYWKSYMTKKQIDDMKQSLVLIADNQLYAGCNINSDWFEEPTFHGSDADRAIYYMVEDEN